MSQNAEPKLKEFARRLLACEAASDKPIGAKKSAAFHVCEKLRGPLGQHLGMDGFRSLLSRALALAGAEVPWLMELQLKTDGSLKGLDKLAATLDADAIAEGESVLVAQLLGLLMTFIGRALTLGFVRGTWPDGDFSDLNFGK